MEWRHLCTLTSDELIGVLNQHESLMKKFEVLSYRPETDKYPLLLGISYLSTWIISLSEPKKNKNKKNKWFFHKPGPGMTIGEKIDFLNRNKNLIKKSITVETKIDGMNNVFLYGLLYKTTEELK